MPTPVAAARQCLTPDAARALDDAITVARCRRHSQTTSLHTISAFLSLPSSTLRDACFRSGSCSRYPARIQMKTLEISLSLFLERQPSGLKRTNDDGGGDDDPPVSNSLMAAIKRSQANQRRHPDHFQSSSACVSVSSVKVELKYLILSILDDPIVSRVFTEAGFRSYDVKLAIVHPPPSLRFPHARRPPLFLCDLDDDSDLCGPSFSYPFAGFPHADGDCKRIGDVLTRNSGRNPLLVGFSAKVALRNFEKNVDGETCTALPLELSGLRIVSIEGLISKYTTGECNDKSVELGLEEVERMAEHCLGPGLVVNYGDLKVLINSDTAMDAVSCIVTHLTRLLKANCRRMWLLGATETFETYLIFLSRFPSISKQWDLQLLHINALRASMGQSYCGSCSYRSRCEPCKKKCEHELSSPCRRVFTEHSILNQCRSALPSWLQMAELGGNKRLDVVQAEDVDSAWNAEVDGLQKKWKGHQHLHAETHSTDGYQMNSQTTGPIGSGSDECGQKIVRQIGKSDSNSGTDSSNPRASAVAICKAGDSKLFAKLWEEDASRGGNSKPDITFLPSIASATTDLGLANIAAAPSHQNLKKPSNRIRSNFSSNIDFKTIHRTLAEKIGWQTEAVSVISQAIAHHRSSNQNLQRALWMNFVGRDRYSKRKVAVVLAEALYGSKKNLIGLDLGSADGRSQALSNFGFPYLNTYHAKQRGSTVMDYVARVLCNTPLSIVLLENVDQADTVAQSSISYALTTGKFPNSHGREVCSSDAVFITTTTSHEDEMTKCAEEQERILQTKPRSMQIVIEGATSSSNNPLPMNKRKSKSYSRVHKTPHKRLDLNLPAEENEDLSIIDAFCENPNSSKPWLTEFLARVDESVDIKPFDYDAVAEKLVKDARKRFRDIVGSQCSLEIDPRVVDQIVAAAMVSDDVNVVEDWVEGALSNGFVEALKIYNLDSRTVARLMIVEKWDGCRAEHEQDEGPEIWLPSKIVINSGFQDVFKRI